MYTLKWCSVKWIFSIVSPKAKSLLFCPILFHRIKIMKQFQMENTNRCHAMNYPRGEIKFTHNLNLMRQKTEIFVIPNICFIKIYSTVYTPYQWTAFQDVGYYFQINCLKTSTTDLFDSKLFDSQKVT